MLSESEELEFVVLEACCVAPSAVVCCSESVAVEVCCGLCVIDASLLALVSSDCLERVAVGAATDEATAIATGCVAACELGLTPESAKR